MENYTKGSNIEKQLELSDVPIKDLPTDVTWMKVKPGSKMDNLITFALQLLQTGGKTCQLWTGIGPAIGKTISCAEIIKSKCQNLHQLSKICYHQCEEIWEPKLEGLDELRVVRSIPVIHIFLSTEPLDATELGYQPPNNSGAFWRANTKTVNSKKDKPNITKCARNQFKKQGRNKSNN